MFRLVLVSLPLLLWSAAPVGARTPSPCDGVGFMLATAIVAGDTIDSRGPVRFADRKVSFGTFCAPVRVHAKRRGGRFVLHARWRHCDGLRGVVRISAQVDEACTSLTGTLRAPRAGVHAQFAAAASHCGDGIVDPARGEQCDGGGCPTGNVCQECTCVPLPQTTTTTSATILSSTTSTSSVPPTTVSTTSITSTSTTTSTTTTIVGQSIARQWDEEILNAIRRDTPRPTVHARNLFHLSAAMWDAWAAYDTTASQYFVSERATADDVETARAETISYAAYCLLKDRYQDAVGSGLSETSFSARMSALGYDPHCNARNDDPPATALGIRIATAVLAFGQIDGANEGPHHTYADPSYAPVNPPLIVQQPGVAPINDPNHWQPLYLEKAVTQNDIITDKVQTFIGSAWGRVKPFALVKDNGADIYFDPGPPPRIPGPALPPLNPPDNGDAYRQSAVDLIGLSSELTPDDGVMIDISPGKIGNNDLGTNNGSGHPTNCATGAPYPPNVVRRGDWARVLAEFWADGPNSETPPGHWNVIANQVSDQLPVHRLAGTTAVMTRLEWDVKLYFAVNGAVHDAAIGAWGTKRKYDSARPITMIRLLAELAQVNDPLGLPLIPGLIEVITQESSAPGQRHEELAAFQGEIAIFAWPGQPASPATQHSGARWIRALTWVPYQKSTFVTPAFPGFTSGHSTFSRAAAEVLTDFTGTACVPGGLGHFFAAQNAYLSFEQGPSEDVDMQWATYYDAADLAGRSRLYGGIHIAADDFNGRIMGSTIGKDAAALARRYFDGSIGP